MCDRLAELAHGDFALRDEHGRRDASMRRVRCGRGRSVAGRCADDGLRAVLERLRDRHGHSSVLERTRRVHALELDPDRGSRAGGERRGGDERGAALAEGDDGRGVRYVQSVCILTQHTAPLPGRCLR